MTTLFKSMVGCVLAMVCLPDGMAWADATPAAAYPVKSIRLITPSAPGSPPDLAARAVGAPLAAAFGQAVVIDNRPGATGTIGLAQVARAAPDGYTICVLGMPSLLAPHLYSRLPYDTARDLEPVRQIAWNAQLLVVHAESSWRSIDELIAAARAKPGVMTFGSGGNGTPPHLIAEALKQRAGLDVRHIPFKGAAAGVAAVLGRQVDFMFAAAAAASENARAGRLRALAAVAPNRLAAHPDVPTLAELGHLGLEVNDWYGIVAPVGTPGPVVRRLAAELQRALVGSEARARLNALMMEPALESGPEQFRALIRADLVRWAKIASASGLRPD